VLLGNLAIRMNQTLELDSQSGRVTNAKVPEAFVKTDSRNGWSL
jgi:hypothetical protein